MASIHAENILCLLNGTPRGIQHGIALTPGVGITSMALSALVTHPDSAVQLIKRYTTIRPCQHHSHPQKELFAFLSLFLNQAEDTHIMEIRVVPRMKIENSECCPGSPPLLRTIGPSSAESLVHTPATYRHYCRHYQIGHLHAPPWFRTRSLSPPPPSAFSHIIFGQLLGRSPSTPS